MRRNITYSSIPVERLLTVISEKMLKGTKYKQVLFRSTRLFKSSILDRANAMFKAAFAMWLLMTASLVPFGPALSAKVDPSGVRTMCLSRQEEARIQAERRRHAAGTRDLYRLIAHILECEAGSDESKKRRIEPLVSDLQKRGDHGADAWLKYGSSPHQ